MEECHYRGQRPGVDSVTNTVKSFYLKKVLGLKVVNELNYNHEVATLGSEGEN